MGLSAGKPQRRYFIQRVGTLSAMLFLLPCLSWNAKAMGVRGYVRRTTETALIMSVRSRDLHAMRALLAAGVKVDDRDEYAGRTALMWAADLGSVSAVRLLLNNGADASLRDDEGTTALTIAKKHRYVDIVRILQQTRMQRIRGGLTSLRLVARSK